MKAGARNFLLLLALAASWGPSFLFIKVAVKYVPPIALTAIRMAIASLILFTILKIRGVKLPKLKPILKHFTVSALVQGAIPFTLFGVAEKTVDSSFASIFSGAAPLFAIVLAHFFLPNDRLTKAKVSGACVGFIGLFFLIMPSLINAKADIFGIILLVIAASCYSIAFIYAKKFINVAAFPPLTIPTIQLFISFVILTAASLIFENPFSINYISLEAVLSLLGLGIIGTAIAFVLYYKLIAATSVSYISMVNYMVPVFGVALGMLILKEQLTWNSYLGGILILIGVMLANGVINLNKFIKN
ncbi:MAG: DMT family transporter [Proteobacteria bacterium]|nr:DMT family transporter [Pseudomonadota bacterium]